MRAGPCVICRGEMDEQPDCRECGGSGLIRSIPYATQPWHKVVDTGGGGLWMGGMDYSIEGGRWRVPVSAPQFAEANFDVVVSFYLPPVVPDGVEHHYHRIPDGPLGWTALREVRRLADVAVDRLDEGKKVLIHCQAGLNRSGLCTALALMRLGWTGQEAIDHLRAIRSPYCLCNADFVDYLLQEIP